MCGLAGSINSVISGATIDSVMHHRGPDEQAIYASRNVTLYHLRLAILDIAGGHQPMHLENKYTIVFNGEIYNHQELRHRFNIQGRTASDTETLLILYDLYGPGMLEFLDGMFVFVIHDKVKDQLFVARDRAGKKPFYYFLDDDKFLFASELNCLRAMTPLLLEENNIFHYLRLGTFYGQLTPYKNVKELKGGCYLTINCNSLKLVETRWWDINKYYQEPSGDTFLTALAKIDELLHQSVKRRLESSDLEVGCFLSGGIDSGLITAIAKGYNPSIKTFTVSFKGEYDEAPLAKQVADRYQTNHHEIQISFADIKNDLEMILTNYGEPFFDSSAIPSYYVSREAKKHLTVILNGDGADELFGGYRRYVPFSKLDFFNQGNTVQRLAKMLKVLLPLPKNKKSKYNYLYRLTSLASKSDLGIYLSAGVDIFEDFEQHILTPSAKYLDPIREDFNKVISGNLSGLKKIMNLDFDTTLFSDLLVKMDIATMSNSLEGRSPFLSKEILEYAPTLPDRYKIHGNTTKYLLRQLATKYLPSDLINQPKRGFEIPLKQWVDGQLKEIIFDYLSPGNAFCKRFVNGHFVDQLLQHKVNVPNEKRAKILWTLLSLEIWHTKVYLSTLPKQNRLSIN